MIERALAAWIDEAAAALPYISDRTSRAYFGKVREYQGRRILAVKAHSPQKQRRLTVIDLPSLRDSQARRLAVSAILGQEWDQAKTAWFDALGALPDADTRVPTFIVVDEAHHLMAADVEDVADRALREQFRAIAAEGRKYGLFLILVSQRPDKLDGLVVSECENKALMRIDSVAVLDVVERLLGLEATPRRTLEKCLEFTKGRVLLLGEWAGKEELLLYCAARRTLEGGRNLRSGYWAVPERG